MESKFINQEQLKEYAFNRELGCWTKGKEKFFIRCFSMGNKTRHILLEKIG